MTATPTFYYGADVRNAAPLQSCTAEALVAQMRAPGTELARQVARLRQVQTLDARRYRKQKVGLPFFIGATFREGQRRTETFERIDYFALDFDGLRAANHDPVVVRARLQTDERVLLLFTSPGGDGLKVVCALEQPCAHTKQFTDFYRWFGTDFARRHHLTDCLDVQTSDVTRVCFLSHDPDAYHFPLALPVAIPAAAALPEVLAAEAAVPPSKTEAARRVPQASPPATPATRPGVAPDTYRAIRQKLNPKGRPAPVGPAVPEPLERLVPLVAERATDVGVPLAEARNISYGKKLVFRTAQQAFAEINVFYGKAGFTVVNTPKRGHDPELTEVMNLLVWEVIYAYQQQWRAALS